MLLPDEQKKQIESQYQTRLSELEKELNAAQQMIASQQQILKSNFANTTLAQPPIDTAPFEETPLPPLKPLSNVATNDRPPVKLPDFGPPIGNIANTVFSAAAQGRDHSVAESAPISDGDTEQPRNTRALRPAIVTIGILSVVGLAAVVMHIISPPITLSAHNGAVGTDGMAGRPNTDPASIVKNHPRLAKRTISSPIEPNKDFQSGPSLLPKHISSALTPPHVHHDSAAIPPHRITSAVHQTVRTTWVRPAVYTVHKKTTIDRKTAKPVLVPYLSSPITAVRKPEPRQHPVKFHKRPRQAQPNVDVIDRHDPPGWDEDADRWIDNLP